MKSEISLTAISNIAHVEGIFQSSYIDKNPKHAFTNSFHNTKSGFAKPLLK